MAEAQQVAAILLPVFLIASVGFVWSRTQFDFNTDFVARLVMNIAAPCLVLDTLHDLQVPASDLFLVASVGALSLAVAAVFSLFLLSMRQQSVRSYLPVLTFGNAGNMGLPLCLFAFGEVGLGLGIGIFIVSAIGQLGLAPILQARQGIWRSLLTTPVIYATVAGVLLLNTDTQLPTSVGRAVELLGQIAIPMMLLAMGYSLGKLSVANLGQSVFLGVARLVLGLLAGVLAAWLFDLEGVLRGVVVLQSAMPAAVFNYLLAERYQRSPDDVAGGIVVSSILSIATLPFLLAWLLV